MTTINLTTSVECSAPPATESALSLAQRHLTEWRLCPICARRLEHERRKVGLAGCAVCYCPRNAVHATYHAGQLSLVPCGSREDAERIDAGYAVFLAQVQAMIANAPGSPSDGAN